MGQQLKTLRLALLPLLVFAVSQIAKAEKRYPAADNPWDATDYRAMVQRIENNGLELPTLSNAETKIVFERMINADNIPQRMGKNKSLAITIRFQRLEPVLKPLQQIMGFYSDEMQKGKSYATELAKVKLFTLNSTGLFLDIADSYIESLPKDKSYNAIMDDIKKTKDNARTLYIDVIKTAASEKPYNKTEIIELAKRAVDVLGSYLSILTDQDRIELTRVLSEQITKTTDPQVRTSLTELRDSIKHGRVRT